MPRSFFLRQVAVPDEHIEVRVRYRNCNASHSAPLATPARAFGRSRGRLYTFL
jgi:hypothetical protein